MPDQHILREMPTVMSAKVSKSVNTIDRYARPTTSRDVPCKYLILLNPEKPIFNCIIYPVMNSFSYPRNSGESWDDTGTMTEAAPCRCFIIVIGVEPVRETHIRGRMCPIYLVVVTLDTLAV
ncbi:hypothetical protein EVAR_30423_1 [Eumeta japonica]|uniref:Uncharacterized protein n=1 Tax=Eumeta variegata TaxID=151549 RepID=A0A4C1W6X1_EUMVA|nr:hypothetical protein EVAR_30423_1 [Eumeta japonica]